MKDYKKILEGVVNIINTTEKSDIGFANICAYIGDNCPKLKESEDERIRKELLNAFQESEDSLYMVLTPHKRESFIAWIEKQGEQKPTIEMKTPEESLGIDSDTYNKIVDECIYGEQKPADKVEPKFKVGDWVVTSYGKVNQIVSVDKDDDDGYTLDDGTYFSGSWCDMFHLWTIQDAKDGDVLSYENENENELRIFIYKNGHIHYHCCYYNGHLTAVDSFFVVEKYLLCYIHPATKEQRDLLFQKMKEAGYEWDAEKKELKKIEQKPTIEMKTPEESLGIDSKTYNKIVDECIYGEQKPAWSEEDESWFKELELMALSFSNDDSYRKKFFDWLKSLKDRVQPRQEQEWSEEDEKIRSSIINFIRYELNHSAYIGTAGVYSARQIEWLKSLRPQNTWKPSDEQMKALKEACDEHWEPDGLDPLYVLWEQLKKLREE